MFRSKILAFYLPQFHEIPENDVWWGKGFTEWTNVKKANPLFFGHRQPRVPMSGFYYDLSDVSTLRWQADLMKQFSIDGLCFYHYWFNGHQLLQKPLSLLLNNPEIEMPFCISWANEPWTRAWDGGNKQVLMAQQYGGEIEWRQHFEYLLSAFMDHRYLKVDGKPIILIYRAASIPCLGEMQRCWRSLAIEHGLPGIHLVSMNTVFKDPYAINGFDATVDFEPMHTIGHHLHGISRYARSCAIRFRRVANRYFPGFKKPEDRISYHMIWRNMLGRSLRHGCYAGAFVDWDNTPRKSERGLVIDGASPEAFFEYFSQQYKRCCEFEIPYVFVNAWNEWAEGTYLEPDADHGYGYLEAIKRAKEF